MPLLLAVVLHSATVRPARDKPRAAGRVHGSRVEQPVAQRAIKRPQLTRVEPDLILDRRLALFGLLLECGDLVAAAIRECFELPCDPVLMR